MTDMTRAEYHDHRLNNAGFCKNCQEVSVFSGVEPDGEGIECPDCGGKTVVGIEDALLTGLIFLED